MDYFLTKRSMPVGKKEKCGDTGFIKQFGNTLFIAIVDIAGHGEQANKLAKTCEEFFKKNYKNDLIKMMKALHERLKGSRGAVVGLSSLDIKTGILKYVGMGNIILRKFGASHVRIVPRSGIVGYIIKTPQEEVIKLHTGDVLLFYTDGVKEHFELSDYPELLKDDAKTIATNVVSMFGKEEDDACCIALRFE